MVINNLYDLFTKYIMKVIATTDELRQYVSWLVAKASGDLQLPTVDRDNIFQMFGLN